MTTLNIHNPADGELIIALPADDDLDWPKQIAAASWEEWLDFREDHVQLDIVVYHRADREPGYLVDVHSPNLGGSIELLRFDHLPELLDHLARWSAIVRDELITRIVSGGVNPHSVGNTYSDVAVLAAHLQHGLSGGYTKLMQERRERHERQRRNRS